MVERGLKIMSNSLNSGEHWIIQFVEDLPEMKVGDDRDGISFLVETTSVKMNFSEEEYLFMYQP